MPGVFNFIFRIEKSLFPTHNPFISYELKLIVKVLEFCIFDNAKNRQTFFFANFAIIFHKAVLYQLTQTEKTLRGQRDSIKAIIIGLYFGWIKFWFLQILPFFDFFHELEDNFHPFLFWNFFTKFKETIIIYFFFGQKLVRKKLTNYSK